MSHSHDIVLLVDSRANNPATRASADLTAADTKTGWTRTRPFGSCTGR